MKTNSPIKDVSLFLLFGCLTATAGINDGLVTHYPLDGNVLDTSGHGRHGTNTGVSFAPGTNGLGAVFDGSSSRHIRVDEIPQLESNLTIAAWFKPQNLTRFSVGSPLLTKGQSGGEAYFLFVDYEFLFGVLNGGYADVGTFKPAISRLTNGVFYHAAMVYDAAQGKVRLYLNAALQGEYAYAQPIHPRNGPLYLGFSPAGGQEVFKGTLDDVRIYDRALDAADICELAGAAPRLEVRTSQVELCWDTLTNKTYQLQFRPSITTNLWSDLGGTIQGTGTRHCIPDPIPTGQQNRIYRAVILP